MFLKQSDISWLIQSFPLFSGTSEGESYLVVTLLPRYIYLLVKILYDLCVVSISCVSTKISQWGKCEIKKHFHTTFRSLTFVCRMKGVKAKDINIPHLCYVSNAAWQRGRHRMWRCHEIQKCLLPYHQIHPQHSAIDKCLNLITCNFTGIQEIKNNNAEMANLQFRNSWKCVSFFSDGEQVESVTNSLTSPSVSGLYLNSSQPAPRESAERWQTHVMDWFVPDEVLTLMFQRVQYSLLLCCY